ncbi:MAG: hypothetical protein LBO65_05785 [Spirochaetaceae bacterium]|jgi:hypothetical protein|nr:hypothetical protein [Spirochaetaceae bacterium]
MKKYGKICHHLFLIPAAAAFIAVLGCAVMLLWNALLPRIAGLRPLTFWEAAGLLILVRILFGGTGGMMWHHGHKNPFKDKWLHMSDEERREFAARFHGFSGLHQGTGAEGDRPSGPGSTPAPSPEGNTGETG